MNWIQVSTPEQVENIKSASFKKPQIIFKHSTRCSISNVVLNRFERSEENKGFDYHFLDLIKYRDISNSIAETFKVHHESPQVLLIKDGECIYDESHYAINMDDIIASLLQNN